MSRLILTLAFTWLSATAGAAGVKTGDVAPDFSLPAAEGGVAKLSDHKGKIVILEWFNKDCPYVRKFYDSKTMQRLQKEMTADKVVWLTITSSAEGREGFLTRAEAAKVKKDLGMASTALLLDEKGQVGRLYAAKTTPHMYIVDPQGKLVYQGAIDDRPSAQPKSLDGAQNYVSDAVAALKKGSLIKSPSTTPYGCSVKY